MVEQDVDEDGADEDWEMPQTQIGKLQDLQDQLKSELDHRISFFPLPDRDVLKMLKEAPDLNTCFEKSTEYLNVKDSLKKECQGYYEPEVILTDFFARKKFRNYCYPKQKNVEIKV